MEKLKRKKREFQLLLCIQMRVPYMTGVLFTLSLSLYPLSLNPLSLFLLSLFTPPLSLSQPSLFLTLSLSISTFFIRGTIVSS